MHSCVACTDAQQFDTPKSPVRFYWSSIAQSASDDGKAPCEPYILPLADSNTLISEPSATNASCSLSSFDHADSTEYLAFYVKGSASPRPAFPSLLQAMDAQRYDFSLASNHSLPLAEVAPRSEDESVSVISSIVFAKPRSRDSLPSLPGVRERYAPATDENDQIGLAESWTVSYVIAPTTDEKDDNDDTKECTPSCSGGLKSPDFEMDNCFPFALNSTFSSSVFSLDRLNCLGSTDVLDETRRDRNVIDDLIAKRERELAGEPPIHIWVTRTTEERVEETWRDPVREILYGRFADGKERNAATVSRD